MDCERQDVRGRCRRHLCHQGRRDPQLQGDRRFTFGTSRCPPQFPLHPREPIVTLASARYSTTPSCSVEKKVVMTVRVGVSWRDQAITPTIRVVSAMAIAGELTRWLL